MQLTLLQSERPKLYGVLAFLSAIGLTCNPQSTQLPAETVLQTWLVSSLSAIYLLLPAQTAMYDI